jgi:alkanesulfonate monooxygenase SsuD/methylene tetrahydromethanopterin reductase-like flavin-dependent oxidoreductase (luciferase family)
MTGSSAGRLPITFSTRAGNQSFEQALSVAQAAEKAGFSGVSFSDRPHDPILEGWTLATAIAARTERIRVFHTTLNVPFRFAAVLAKEAATLDIISNGRLDLCLGAGGDANRPLYDSIGVPLAAPGERLTDLVDAITIMRGMWAHDKFTYKGRAFHVEEAVGVPAPVQQPIPIWIGARLPRSLRIAGRLADGFVKNGGWGTVEELKQLNDAVTEAAVKAGRDPYSVRRVLNGALAYVAKDAADAEAYRTQAVQTQGSRAGERVSGLIGTVDEIVETVKAYREAGVDTFVVNFAPQLTLQQIERFGAEVIPAASTL